MGIMLGNFSIEAMENKLNIKFPEELKEIMVNTRQEDVSHKIKEGKWHCFHLPFVIVCGNKDFAVKIAEYLKPLAEEMTGTIEIAWQ